MDLLIKQFIIISVFITYSIIYGQINIVEAFPNLSFTIPLDLQHAPDGSDRIFVVEKQGHIYVFENDPDVTEKTLFLDYNLYCNYLLLTYNLYIDSCSNF